MQGPSSYETVARLTVVSGAPGTGVFIYNSAPGRGTLIAAAVGAAGTDPTGQNTVSPVLSVGQWSSITGLPGAQSMVDANGDLSVVGSDGVTRLKIWTGGDGIHHAGSVYWFNDFGAVIQVIDPVVRATFQYQDNGSAVQGGVIGAQVSAIVPVTDPVVGTNIFQPGVTIIDPVFGDNLLIQGDVVAFDQLGMTRKCFISSQDPSGGTNAPYLVIEGPEHTTASHPNIYILGATQDGTTHAAKIIYSVFSGGPPPGPTYQTNAFVEIQGTLSATGIDAIVSGATETWHSVAPSHAGMGGSINYKKMAQTGEVMVVLRTNAAAATTITSGDVIGTLPAGYRPGTDNEPLVTTYSPFGGITSLQPLNVNTAGQITWTGATVTTPAGGFSFIYSIPAQIPTDL